LSKGDESIIIDVHGVGYEVFLEENYLKRMEKGQSVELFICMYVRETKMELYGFPSLQQVAFFELLEGISGVGPKIALSLVRFKTPENLKIEVEQRGDDLVKEIKGVGKKKLKRVLLELTGKIKSISAGVISERKQGVHALRNLGFSKEEAEKAITKVSLDIKDQNKVVEEALKWLGQDEESA